MRFLGTLVVILAATSLAGDFSRVPIPSKRAYGRVRDQLFTPSFIQLKQVSILKSKNREGQVVDSAKVFTLLLKGSDGQGFAACFTTPRNSLAKSTGIRQSALTRGTSAYNAALFPGERRVPIGLTSAQMMFVNPKTGLLETKVYRDRVTLQLNLIPSKDQFLGQILLVLPDVNRSFVCGAFKVPR
jgi:hypothetical protein